jgi:hypothetical protein
MKMKRDVKGFTITRNLRINVSVFITSISLIIVLLALSVYFLKPEIIGIIIGVIAIWQIGSWAFSIGSYLHEGSKIDTIKEESEEVPIIKKVREYKKKDVSESNDIPE